MRGSIADLVNPHPLGEALPAMYQEESFVQRFTQAFDQALAPVVCVLDNIADYFDPSLTPEDFVPWLAGWVGLSIDEDWPLDRQRALAAQAVEIYGWTGTAQGLRRLIAIYTDEEPVIEDSGGVSSSATPGGALPGTADAVLTVRLPASAADDVRRVEAIVAAAKPAHVAHRIEVGT